MLRIVLGHSFVENGSNYICQAGINFKPTHCLECEMLHSLKLAIDFTTKPSPHNLSMQSQLLPITITAIAMQIIRL